MRWLRWKGFIAFIIIAALLMGLWFMLIDTIARSIMEKTATKLVGAEVNISDVDLKLAPLGVTLQGIEVTNPNDPQTNAVQITSLICSLETAQLFLRKVIIDEMSITGMAFGTKRERPGFVTKEHKEKERPPGEKAALMPTLPSFSKEDIGKILESEDLKTLDMIRSIQEETQARKAFWEKRMGEIPDKEDLEQYEKRIEDLKKIDQKDPQSILAATGKIKSLQEDIQKDIRILKDAQTRFNTDYATISEQMKQVKNAPADDLRSLVKKYGPTPQGLGNVSAVLFGEKIGVWVERSLFWYQKINPILDRSREEKKGQKVTKPLRAAGVDIHFREHTPLPDFLVRKATASVNLEQGTVQGNLFNITTDQDILGSPLSFDFSGDKLKGITTLRLQGSMNRVDPKQNIDKLDVSMKGYALHGVDLGAKALPVTLEKGTMNMDLSTSVVNNIISAELKGSVSSAKLTVADTADTSRFSSAVSSAFSGIDSFSLQASLKGTPQEYTMNLKSDLEKVVSGALQQAVADLTKQFEGDLRTALQTKIETPLNSLQSDVSSLDTIEKELTGRKNLADTLLKKAVPTPSQKGGLKLPF